MAASGSCAAIRSDLPELVNFSRNSSAEVVLDHVPDWFADYNAVAPHSALKDKSPLEYGAAKQG